MNSFKCIAYRTFILCICSIMVFACNQQKQPTILDGIEEPLIAELEYKIDAALGEGALWNYKTQELYWVDIEKQILNIYNPKSKTNKSINMPSRIGTVVPVDSNVLLSALEDGVYETNIKTGVSELFVDMNKELLGRRLNDGKCDPNGRFWVGSMHMEQEKGKAQLFMIDANKQLQVKIDAVTISNGIVWTSDKTKMYYIDTPTSEIKSYDYDNTTGVISNEKMVVEIPESLGFPDGMTIDSQGMLWVGMWNGYGVIQFNPNTGKVMQRIKVPAQNVTSCAFGGENLDILYITTAQEGMTKKALSKYPLSGSIFKVKSGSKGVKCSFYNEAN